MVEELLRYTGTVKLFEKKVELGLWHIREAKKVKRRGKVLSAEEGVTRIEKCHFSAYRVKMEIDEWKSLLTEVFRMKVTYEKFVYFSILMAPT